MYSLNNEPIIFYSYYMLTNPEYSGPTFGYRSLAHIYLNGDCYSTVRRNVQEKMIGIEAASDQQIVKTG